MSSVVVVIGPGSIGQAIARRVSVGKCVLLADLRQENADAAAEVLSDAGYEVSTTTVDVSSRESVQALIQKATADGDVTGVIHAAGVSPSQASPETILSVDLYGTAVVLEEFGSVIAFGGAGVVIASQSGHRLGALTAEETRLWRRRLPRSCSPCQCFSRCGIPCTPTSSLSVVIQFVLWLRRCDGASEVRESTRSAPGSSSRH